MPGVLEAQRRQRRLLGAACCCLAAAPAAAQKDLHPVVGMVLGGDVQPIAGAEALAVSSQRSALSNAAGVFRLDSVPGGSVRIVVRKIGYLAFTTTARVPQAPGDTLRIILARSVQQLDPLIVNSDRPGLRGVVGDTGYRALPGTVVELLGARRDTVTDDRGRFAFERLKPGQYMLRVSRQGYLARLIPVEFAKKGLDYSIFMDEYVPGKYDWANSHEAAGSLADLATRLTMENHWTRMTRAELDRYGTIALCEVPRVRSVTKRVGASVLMRTIPQPGVDLCAYTADQFDLIEWGSDPCREASRSIADALHVNCGPAGYGSLYASAPGLRGPWFNLWPRT